MTPVQQPAYQSQEWKQDVQPRQQQQQHVKRKRWGGGKVTRLVGDILIFVEVLDGKEALGLVFRPDKIEGYAGESFEELGLALKTHVELLWDPDTLLVESVKIEGETHEPLKMSAGA